MGKSDMRAVQNLRDSLVDRVPTVEVAVPRELSVEQHNKLLNTFNALADKEVELEISIDPELVGGVKVRIGDIILDNSIGSHLTSLRDEINQKLESLAATNND
jgi:F-type H+-transporting ATPase subunit delta